MAQGQKGTRKTGEGIAEFPGEKQPGCSNHVFCEAEKREVSGLTGNENKKRRRGAVSLAAAALLISGLLTGCSGLALSGNGTQSAESAVEASASVHVSPSDGTSETDSSNGLITWSLAPTAVPVEDAETADKSGGDRTEARDASSDILTVTDGTLSEEKQPAKTAAWQADLPAGNYFVGTDIPAGDYDFSVVSGSGNAEFRTGRDSGTQVLFGTGEGQTAEYEDARLLTGGVLHIHGSLVLRASSEAADAAFEAPSENTDQAFELAAGSYTAGEDFPAGIYIIDGTGTAGSVSSDTEGDGGVTEKIAAAAGDADTATEFRNAYFSDGGQLTLGTSVRMTPVG